MKKISKTLAPKLVSEVEVITGTMREKVQKAAEAVLLHAYHYQDWTLSNKLIEACGQGVKKDKVVNWLVTYGGLIAEGGKFTGWSGNQHIEDNFREGCDPKNHWFANDKSTGFEGLDMEAVLQRVLKQYDNAVKKCKNMEDDVKAEKLKRSVSDATIQQLLNIIQPENMVIEVSKKSA